MPTFFRNILNMKKTLLFTLLSLCTVLPALAQNPFITNQFTADPTARVFGDRIYVYPSHDIPCTEGRGRPGWFCMADYHVFSSPDLTEWTDHGVIVSQDKVDWVKPESYSMWAPDCIERNGKYYFYFPSTPADTTNGRGFKIGVAVSDKPTGPFVPEKQPIKGVNGIDPNVFIDKDGQAYLYWSQRHIYVAKLKENMLELASEPKIIPNLPEEGLKEGPFVFERNGIYYLTYPHVENKIERLEYAVGKTPEGPFTVTGVIMDESPTGCWTNHHSLLPFKGQWYLFYHHNDLSPEFDKNRSIRIDRVGFNEDGTIKKVMPTLRGVGITKATSNIQLDRYSAISGAGVQIAFVDTTVRWNGWNATLEKEGAWLRYNTVVFAKKPRSIVARVQSNGDGVVELRRGGEHGALISTMKVPAAKDWKEMKFPVSGVEVGTHDLAVVLKNGAPVEIDWVRFE